MSSSSSPLPSDLFPPRSLSSSHYSLGDNTLTLLCRSLPASDVTSLLSLLSRPGGLPSSSLPPLLCSISHSPFPLLSLRLFLSLPSPSPSLPSFNALLSSFPPLPISLSLPFFLSALRRFPTLKPNLRSFNLLLKSLSPFSINTSLHILHYELPRRGLKPDAYTYSTVISSLSSLGRTSDAVSLLHEMLLDPSITPNPAVFNPILGSYLRSGDTRSASKLYRFMLLKDCKPSLASYNTLIHGLLMNGRANAALVVLRQMNSDGLAPGPTTFGVIAHGLASLGRPFDALKVLDQMRNSHQIQPNEFVYCAIINGFFKSGELDQAIKVWEEMVSNGTKPNMVLYTALIDGLARHGKMEQAEESFLKMVTDNCLPNLMTYNSLIKGYFKAGNIQRALDMWQEMVDSGFTPNKICYSILIKGLCDCGRLKEGMMVWKNMLAKGCVPDVIAYSSMIKGLCDAGLVDGGLKLFNDMAIGDDAVVADVVTYNILFDGLLKVGEVARAMDLLAKMLDRACDPDVWTCNVFLRELKEEEKKREFLEGLVGRLCKRGRFMASGEVLGVMLEKFIVPSRPIWDMVVKAVFNRRRVWRAIDNCRWAIWGS